ncbi:MAG: EAL domain-containing protein [Marinomonas atlantica]|nr:EAL domain-containing protein [Marinomonas atlantica]
MLIVVIGGYFITLSNTNYVQNQRLMLSSIARTQATEIERSLSLSFTSTQILAHQITLADNKLEHFDSYAKNIMQSIPGIDNIQLAPNGVIEHIYPLEGNEGALGLDVLNHSKYSEAARTAIENRNMIMIGPLNLVQGGSAVISRMPIYKSIDGPKSNEFWGFASALIMLTPLLNNTGIHELEKEGYAIKIEREHADSSEIFQFYRSLKPLNSDTLVKAGIGLPTGTWTLSISNDINGNVLTRTFNMLLITILLATVCSLSLYHILIRPIELQKEVNKKTLELKELAFKDPLTGLPNRRYLNDHFQQLIFQIKEHQTLGAFIYFDLDNFKSINDTIGHDIGDKVLVEVAKRLYQHKRTQDIVIRLGGDEFAIVVTQADSIGDVEDIAQKIISCTQKIINIDHKEFKQSTSLGITLIPNHGSQALELMQCADVALYEAKRRGKNQFVLFDEAMRKRSLDTHAEELALKKAIAEDQLILHFQPQFDLTLGTIIGAEALVRWNHPEKGLVFPDSFIPLAEQSGQILELGNHVIRKSFEYLAHRESLGLYPILLHINLSSLQLNDPNLVPYVRTMIEQFNIPGHYIGFEITETTLLTDLKQAKKTLGYLKAMGICIAIDDFGTGFSSLGQLKNLPVDLLKIDRSFVWDLEADKDDRMIVEAIIAMAHKLGILVIAEGVETRAQLEMLKSFNCDLGQGYFISRPIPQEQFDQFPENRSVDQLMHS